MVGFAGFLVEFKLPGRSSWKRSQQDMHRRSHHLPSGAQGRTGDAREQASWEGTPSRRQVRPAAALLFAVAVSSWAASREPPLPGSRPCPRPRPCSPRCAWLHPADPSRRDAVPFLRFSPKPTGRLLLLHLQCPGLFPEKPGSLAPGGHVGPHKESEVLTRIEEDWGSPQLDTAGLPGFWASVILAEPVACVKPTLVHALCSLNP